VHEGVCAPAAPLADPAAAAAMLRASLAARPPRAAVEGITLRAHPLRAPKAQPRFDEPPRPSPRLLTAALARLSGLVGASAIGSPELLDSHRPDAMQMTPFVLFSSRTPPLSRQGEILAVRRMRPPRPVHVTLDTGAPAHLHAGGITGRIVAGAGPWRVSGEWWRQDAFVQDEWDVELGDGTLCRLARDGRGWRLEAIYD
jgi:protein ImuB